MSLWPGLDVDDVESLNALASSTTRSPLTFDEAVALISPDAPRASARACWDYLLGYYGTRP